MKIYISQVAAVCHFVSASAYLHSVTEKLAELRPFEHGSQRVALSTSVDIHTHYDEASTLISRVCKCEACVRFRLPSESNSEPIESRKFCLLEVAETMLVTTYLLARARFRYMMLFTGDRIELSSSMEYTSAYSHGGIYCFMESISELSMDYGKASRIHIGFGTIECRSKVHRWVCDKRRLSIEAADRPYSVPSRASVKGLSVLDTDSSSPSLRMEAVVEDTAQLVFYYKISDGEGTRLISPLSFVNDCLLPMTKLKLLSDNCELSKEQWQSMSESSTYEVLYGEGPTLDGLAASTSLVLRPHAGNLLGQCVASSFRLQRSRVASVPGLVCSGGQGMPSK